MQALVRTFVLAVAAAAAGVGPLQAEARPSGRGGAYSYGHVGAGPHWGGGHGGAWTHVGWGHRGGWSHGGRRWGGVGLGIGLGLGWGLGSYYYGAPVYPGYVVTVPAPVYEIDPAPVEPTASAPPDPVIYPRNGQSAEQTEADRQACNRWAMTQPSAMAQASVFQRATLACMEGRGYTVR